MATVASGDCGDQPNEQVGIIVHVGRNMGLPPIKGMGGWVALTVRLSPTSAAKEQVHSQHALSKHDKISYQGIRGVDKRCRLGEGGIAHQGGGLKKEEEEKEEEKRKKAVWLRGGQPYKSSPLSSQPHLVALYKKVRHPGKAVR